MRRTLEFVTANNESCAPNNPAPAARIISKRCAALVRTGRTQTQLKVLQGFTAGMACQVRKQRVEGAGARG